MKKVAIITTHPIQYQAPLWRRLAQYPDIEVHVFFGSDFSLRGYRDKGFGVTFSWDTPLDEGYRSTFLSCDPTINDTATLPLDWLALQRHLLAFAPDCVMIQGYSPMGFYLKALLLARWLRLPVFIRSEATDAALSRHVARKLARHLSLRLLYSQIHLFLAIGQHASCHYRRKGIPPEKIIWSPYCIDSDWLEQQVQTWLPRRESVRRELGFTPEQTVFLFCGKLIAEKAPLIIAEAFQHLRNHDSPRPGLIIVGDGALRPSFAEALQATPEIATFWAGFQNQSQLGQFYCAADCLILPSQGETWGLVVNEALQYGMPAIVSDRVGCHPDLIVEGQTGFVFPKGNAAALAACMSKARDLLRHERPAVYAACREKAQSYAIDRAVAGIYEAIDRLSP